MAQYTVNAAEVKPLSGQPILTGIAAEVIAAGQSITKNGSGQIVLARSDSTAALANCRGVAVSSATLIGQPINYVDEGDVQLDNASIVDAAVGDLASLGPNPGGLYPFGDQTSTQYLTIVGQIIQNSGGTKLRMHPWPTGTQVP